MSSSTTPTEAALEPLGRQRARIAQSGEPDASARIDALDGIRGLAILLVMASHFTLIHSGALVDRLIGAAGRFGWTGVDLFFVLSGFLITGILLDNRDHPHYFRNFYARRTLRIFPLYYLVIAFALIVAPRFAFFSAHFPTPPPDAQPLFWVYLSNFAIAWSADAASNDMLGLTWSLAIEEQYYLVWPVVVWLLSRHRRTLMLVCVAAVAVAIGCRAVLASLGADRVYAFVLTPCRLDGIAMGSLLALLTYRRHPRTLQKQRAVARTIAAGCAVAILAILAWHGTAVWSGGPGQVIGYTFVAALYACALLLVLTSPRDGWWRRAFSVGWLRFLGRYSYALYLFHMPVARLVRGYVYDRPDFHMWGGSALPGQLLFYAIVLPPSLLMALLSWNLLEKHALKLKRHFPARKRATTAAAWEGN